MFTHIIENLVEVCGVHDEVGISHHVVDGVCLRSKSRGCVITDVRQAALFPTHPQPQPSHLLLCGLFGFRVHPADVFEVVLEGLFNFCHHVFNLRDAEADSCLSGASGRTHLAQLACALTKALLSSAKVSLTNMAPRAKPKALSVSLTHSFQRGVQLCKTHEQAC